MRSKQNMVKTGSWLTAAAWLALAVLGLLHFAGMGRKWMALLSGAGIIVMLLRGDRKRLWNAPSLLLLGYAAWSWLTIFWAMSGKFHLREGSKILVAVFFFLLVALHRRMDGVFARRVMSVIAGLSAFFAFMSVEAASTGVCRTLLGQVLSMNTEKMAFSNSRLSGIFGNSNIESSIFAIGIFCAVALVCGAEEKWQKGLWAAALSVSAFAFLLVFSMGAMLCFALAVIVYLIFAGRGRSAALLRMVEAAVPAFGGGILAGWLFGNGRGGLVLPLMLACAAVTAALELLAAERLSAPLERHQGLTFGLILAVLACAVLYGAAALRMTAPYTFGGSFERSLPLSPGAHTVQIDADEGVYLRVYTVNEAQVMLGGTDNLFSGPVEEKISFEVAEDAELCFFSFWTDTEHTQVRSVTVDGNTELPLRYKLLPDFAANRIQWLSLSTSAVQRRVYREDAVKLWKRSPIAGSGVGAFETGISSVQEYPYESKYVHQHYLQVLLEDGVIGLALYAGALAALAAVLWKKRKQDQESGFYWLYPALCAEFVMNGAQMCWDVSMSMIIFLCMTYALYGLIVGAFAEPFRGKAAAAEESGAKKKKTAAKKHDLSLSVRNAGVVFTAVVLVTLAGNLLAAAEMDAPADSGDEFLQHLSTAAKLDLYEHNDAKLSYVIGSLEVGDGHRAQADKYAAELSKVQSNSIPVYLVRYYLGTQQYGAAIDAAILGAAYSASDSDTWKNCCMQLGQAFFTDAAASPMLSQLGELMPKLTAYREALESHNASALQPVELDESAQAFFDEIAALEACGEDETQFLAVLTEYAQSGNA